MQALRDVGGGLSCRPLLLVPAFCVLLLSACAGGPDLGRLAADSSITTGSIAKPAPTEAEKDADSDRASIRSAVASADLTRLPEGGVAWANAVTGSRGTVTGLAEREQQGMLCRQFTSTRESYDGVSLYRGEICLGPAGRWAMIDFGAA